MLFRSVLLSAFADSGINLDLGFWIGDPQEGTGGVRSAINMAIWRAFREQGIEIPFPQREVRLIGNPAVPASPAVEGAVPVPGSEFAGQKNPAPESRGMQGPP